MKSGYIAYYKLVDFVCDNVDYFEGRYGYVGEYDADQWTDVVKDAYATMEMVAGHDDMDDAHCMDSEELCSALFWAIGEYKIDDCQYFMIERNEGVMTLMGRAIKDDVIERVG